MTKTQQIENELEKYYSDNDLSFSATYQPQHHNYRLAVSNIYNPIGDNKTITITVTDLDDAIDQINNFIN